MNTFPTSREILPVSGFVAVGWSRHFKITTVFVDLGQVFSNNLKRKLAAQGLALSSHWQFVVFFVNGRPYCLPGQPWKEVHLGERTKNTLEVPKLLQVLRCLMDTLRRAAGHAKVTLFLLE